MWRAGRSPSENKMLGLFWDVVFGRVYDGPTKLAIKASKAAAETLQAPGLVEYLQEIEAKRALEKGPADTEQGDCDAILASAVNLVDEDHIVVHLPAKGTTMQPKTVRTNAVHDGPKL